MFFFFGNKRKAEGEPWDVEFSVSKESYSALEEWAEEEGISVEDVVSKGIGMYEIVRHYRKQGWELAAVNDNLEVKATMKIPGFTTLESDPSPSKSTEAK